MFHIDDKNWKKNVEANFTDVLRNNLDKIDYYYNGGKRKIVDFNIHCINIIENEDKTYSINGNAEFVEEIETGENKIRQTVPGPYFEYGPIEINNEGDIIEKALRLNIKDSL